MEQTIPFGEVLEAIDKLSLEEQETLIGILHSRLAGQSRKIVGTEIKKARKEFAEGRCQSATADEIMKDVLS
ncbi:MAG: hypothetical protein ABIU05_22230 [Nitrospirales bacterium]